MATANTRHRVWGRSGCPADNGEQGSVLIVALIYLCAVGVAMLSLTGWIANDLGNTSRFSNVREEQLAASSVAELAIQNIRYTPLLSTTQNASPPSSCWGSGPTSGVASIDGFSLNAWCSTVWDPTSAATRVVTISICQSTVSAAGCATSPYLQATITFDDYPPGGAAPVQGPCTDWGWCGEGMTVSGWVWA
jgi:hypothetical protein